MAKTIRTTITIDVLDEAPLMLHETVGSGEYKGEKFELIRSTGQNVHVLKYKNKAYQYTTQNLMLAILDAIEKDAK